MKEHKHGHTEELKRKLPIHKRQDGTDNDIRQRTESRILSDKQKLDHSDD